MTETATVRIHRSQFPDRVRRDLIDSLRARALNHKFLYDGIQQTQRWLALHQAFSPSRTDPDCAAAYDHAMRAAAARLAGGAVHLVGLGCGGGQKDARLLRLLREAGERPLYTPVDVSVAMVLVARNEALKVIPAADCFPLALDLGSTEDLEQAVVQPAAPVRLVTCFGMLPNFEPGAILDRLAALLPATGDLLLVSANLAPGENYAAGVEKILPLYDNDLTRDWLGGFLRDAGFETADGDLGFAIENDPGGLDLKRVTARFKLRRDRVLKIDEHELAFAAGDELRVFFSYRHTPDRLERLLAGRGLLVHERWITRSGEEGVFLATRRAPGTLPGGA